MKKLALVLPLALLLGVMSGCTGATVVYMTDPSVAKAEAEQTATEVATEVATELVGQTADAVTIGIGELKALIEKAAN